jgi:glycosyltransferase involved in cell wall biosynthesis
MNLLFISYWGINEGLTQATVIPNVKILSHYNSIHKVILVTIERGKVPIPEYLSDKTEHIPIQSKSNSVPFFGKIIDFITIPRTLKKLSRYYQVDKIISRGAPGGALAYLISKKTGIPFFVESYEPHADYMMESGVWKKWNLKYLYQKKWEKEQFQNASGIMTVTDGYTNILNIKSNRKMNIITVPCAVSDSEFRYNPADRFKIRNDLGIKKDQNVGIYVGKFGGLYIDINELNILESLFKYFSDLYLIILTSNPRYEIEIKLSSLLNSEQNLYILNVPHNEVPKYLSASDFAISLVKPFHSAMYTSPIKHGEYWANGLPVLMTEGIGDERNFLEKEKGGVQFNAHNLMSSLNKLQTILNDPDHRKKIPELARKYRSFDKVRQAYERMIISPAY